MFHVNEECKIQDVNYFEESGRDKNQVIEMSMMEK